MAKHHGSERDHSHFAKHGAEKKSMPKKSEHWSGTMAHSNMAHHSGMEKGAGELTFGTGPGKAAMRTKAQEFGINKDSGKSDFKAKGMKTTEQGD